MFGERLKRARLSSGLSMMRLAEQVGVSANMIKKYEHDLSLPSSGVLIKLSQVMLVPVGYFFKPDDITLPEIKFRKRANLSKRAMNIITGEVTTTVERWLELENLWPRLPNPGFIAVEGLPERIETVEQAEYAAKQVRTAWHLGEGPIHDLIRTMEDHGIWITRIDLKKVSERFDGLQSEIQGHPIIAVRAYSDGDRQRFTLAHELGHLLIGNRITGELDEEKICNRFAGALLLPDTAMRSFLGSSRRKLEPIELYHLKHTFGISMQACLYRAKDLGIISKSTCKNHFIAFGKRGWRKQEPGMILKPEESRQFSDLVYRALGEDIIEEAKAAELLGITHYALLQERLLEDF